MPRVQELFSRPAGYDALRTTAPASSLSISVVIGLLSLPIRDTVSTFLIVWLVSFLSLCIARIWSYNLKASQGLSRQTLSISTGVTSEERTKSEMSMVERMLFGYESPGRKEMTQ